MSALAWVGIGTGAVVLVGFLFCAVLAVAAGARILRAIDIVASEFGEYEVDRTGRAVGPGRYHEKGALPPVVKPRPRRQTVGSR